MLNRILVTSLIGALVIGCASNDGTSRSLAGAGGAAGSHPTNDAGAVETDSGTGGSAGDGGSGGANPGGSGGANPGGSGGANPGGSGGADSGGGGGTDQGIHFVAYGDSRSNPDDHQTVLDALAKLDPELVLNTGDLWDGYGSNEWKSAVTKNPGIAALLNSNLFLVSRGNHESLSELLDFTPTIVRENEEKYSFTLGDTFFVSLERGGSCSAMCRSTAAETTVRTGFHPSRRYAMRSM